MGSTAGSAPDGRANNAGAPTPAARVSIGPLLVGVRFPTMQHPAPPFVCAHAGEVATFSVTGDINHGDITGMVAQVEPARLVVLDVTQTEHVHSTLIAACIQLANKIGKPVRIRGANKQFVTTLLQMNLQRFFTLVA